jgi:hypothetical protein
MYLPTNVRLAYQAIAIDEERASSDQASGSRDEKKPRRKWNRSGLPVRIATSVVATAILDFP